MCQVRLLGGLGVVAQYCQHPDVYQYKGGKKTGVFDKEAFVQVPTYVSATTL